MVSFCRRPFKGGFLSGHFALMQVDLAVGAPGLADSGPFRKHQRWHRLMTHGPPAMRSMLAGSSPLAAARREETGPGGQVLEEQCSYMNCQNEDMFAGCIVVM